MISLTPLPWRVEADGVRILIDRPDYYLKVADVVSRIDAAFIVRACNAHDKLVASLHAMLCEFSGYEFDEGASASAITAIREARRALARVRA